MHDPALVGGLQGRRDLARDGQRVGNRQLASSEPLGERRSFNEFEDERQDPIRLFEAVNRRNVGVVERGEYPRFALKSGSKLRIQREVRHQQLERDRPTQARVGGAIHLPHAV